MHTTPNHWDISAAATSPAVAQLQAEIDAVERQAAEARAVAAAKLRGANAAQAAWLAVLSAGQGKWQALQNAREQLNILRQRHALAAAEFEKLVGSESYTREWHEAQHADPMLDGWVYGTLTKEENPFVFHARTLAALDLGIARVKKRLPEFERAEADARKAAQDYARPTASRTPSPTEPSRHQPRRRTATRPAPLLTNRRSGSAAEGQAPGNEPRRHEG